MSKQEEDNHNLESGKTDLQETQEQLTSAMSFLSIQSLSLHQADKIANIVINTAERFHLPPIAVVVTDPAGEIIVSKRMDGVPPSIPKVSN